MSSISFIHEKSKYSKVLLNYYIKILLTITGVFLLRLDHLRFEDVNLNMELRFKGYIVLSGKSGTTSCSTGTSFPPKLFNFKRES